MNMNEAFAILGYHRGEGKMPRIDNIAPHGSSRWEKDGVVVSMSNGSLGLHRGNVSYYDSCDSLVLNAVVVPTAGRGLGAGSAALRDVLKALELIGFKGQLFAEACAIGGMGSGMGCAELAAWYERRGFIEDSGGARKVFALAVGEGD